MLHKITQQKIPQKFIIHDSCLQELLIWPSKVFDLAKNLAAIGVLRDGAAHTFDES